MIINGNAVVRLGPGKAFGELALANDVYRNATIRIASFSRLWVIDRKTLRNVLSTIETNIKAKKIEVLKNIPLFSKLSEQMFIQVADLLKVVEFEPNQRVIKQGEVSY